MVPPASGGSGLRILLNGSLRTFAVKRSRKCLDTARLVPPTVSTVCTRLWPSCRSVNGKDHYLGPYGSPESRSEIRPSHCRVATQPVCATASTVNKCRVTILNCPFPQVIQLLLLLEVCQDLLRQGRPADQGTGVHAGGPPAAPRVVRRTLATRFWARKLKAVRQHMVDGQGLRRDQSPHQPDQTGVQVGGEPRNWFPPSVYHGLQTVTGLRFGRTEARETEPVRPVSGRVRRSGLAVRQPARCGDDQAPVTERHASRRRHHAAVRH